MKLTTQQKKEIQNLCTQHQITLLILFGSYARGDMHAHSDIDIGYLSTHALKPEEQLIITQLLQGIFDSTAPIDFVNLQTISPIMGFIIIQEGKTLYATAEVDDEFYRKSIKRFIDAKPLMNATQEYVKQHTL